MDVANTDKKQRGKPFQPGQSGNPDGRPNGSRNKATLAIEELLDGEGEGLTRKCSTWPLAAICRPFACAWSEYARQEKTGLY